MRRCTCNSPYALADSLRASHPRSGFNGENFKFAPAIGSHVAKFVTKAAVDPIVNGVFTPHRFFLEEKLLVRPFTTFTSPHIYLQPHDLPSSCKVKRMA
jgi:hypothetical protein